MWFVNRSGSHVEVRNISTNEVIATVGSDNDPRVMKRVTDATIMSQAPQMLDALIDVQDLIKREFVDTDHPLSELVTTKIDSIIKKCFAQQREKYAPRENRNFRREAYERDNTVLSTKPDPNDWAGPDPTPSWHAGEPAPVDRVT
jgi:hypothetical protein